MENMNSNIDKNKTRIDNYNNLKINEKKIYENRKIIHSILNILPDSALIIDIHGNILVYNEVAQQILCKNDPNPKGKKLLKYFNPDTYGFFKIKAKEVILLKKPVNFKGEQENKFFDINIYPILNSEKKVTQLTIFAKNITGSIKIEESDYRKTVQLERLLETSRYLTSSLDIIEVLTRISTEAKNILKSYGSTIYLLSDDGKKLIPKVVIDPIYEEEILETPLNVEKSYTGQAVLQKKALMFNGSNFDKDGYQIPGTSVLDNERVIAAPFIVDDKVIGALCLNRIGVIYTEEDLALAETFAVYASTALKNAQTHLNMKYEVDKRRKTEKELHENREHLKLINRILRHNVMNNLAAINSSLHIFESTNESKYISDSYRIIKNSVELINRMRELESFSLANKKLRIFDVKQVLNNVIKNHKQLSIKIEGKGTVLADESLASVFENIIANAVLHSGNNKMDIIIKDYKDHCYLYFIDYGKGISSENKSKIFDEGFKFGSTGNSGLGLFIVKKAAISYGGDVFIEDSKPHGTTIVLFLRKI